MRKVTPVDISGKTACFRQDVIITAMDETGISRLQPWECQNYVPSRRTGSACSVCSGLALNDDILTLETFRRWVEKGRSLAYQYNAELYHGTGKRTAFDHYQQKSKTFKLYKEI